MAQSVEALSEKVQKMNLTNEVFYGGEYLLKKIFLKHLLKVLLKILNNIKKSLTILKKNLWLFLLKV